MPWPCKRRPALQGDIRDASEKAWGATKRARDALVLAKDPGERPEFPAETAFVRRVGDCNAITL